MTTLNDVAKKKQAEQSAEAQAAVELVRLAEKQGLSLTGPEGCSTEHQARDGKVYCCAILDCFSRKIVARTFSTTADTALVNNAVTMAVDNRTRSGPTILDAHHGTQFTSWSFEKNMRRWGLLGSFGTIGDCLLTPPWSHSGADAGRAPQYVHMTTTIGLAAAMADYIDNFYNVERRHSYLGNISPIEFERLDVHLFDPSTRLTTARAGTRQSDPAAGGFDGGAGDVRRIR